MKRLLLLTKYRSAMERTYCSKCRFSSASSLHMQQMRWEDRATFLSALPRQCLQQMLCRNPRCNFRNAPQCLLFALRRAITKDWTNFPESDLTATGHFLALSAQKPNYLSPCRSSKKQSISSVMRHRLGVYVYKEFSSKRTCANQYSLFRRQELAFSWCRAVFSSHCTPLMQA